MKPQRRAMFRALSACRLPPCDEIGGTRETEAAPAVCPGMSNDEDRALWVGTYAAKGGQGLYPLDRTAGRLAIGRPEPRIANASYGLWSPATRTAYFVEEQEEGRVGAWRFAAGLWHPLGTRDSGGALPCFLALHPDHTWLAAANYGDGTVGLLALDPASGKIEGPTDVLRLAGRGPDPERQAGPHAHCVIFDPDGDHVFHVDLGLDRVFRHRIEGGRLVDGEVAFEAPAGSGPRHLAFHPDGKHVLLLTELGGELILLERQGARFAEVDRLDAAPEPAEGNLGGHLAVEADGSIFVTNRGHDSLVAFAVVDGRLRRCGWVRTGASSPRHVHVAGSRALVALEEGAAVTLVAAPYAGVGGGPAQAVKVPGAAFIIEVTN